MASKSSARFKLIESRCTQIHLIHCALKEALPVLVRGPIGCGKTALIQYIASQLNRHSYPRFVVIQLGEHIDGKSLIGSYQCSDLPGTFDWEPGPLTKAMKLGSLILLEDLDCASTELLSTLAPVLKEKSLYMPDGQLLRANDDFRIIATIRSTSSDTGHSALLSKDWFTVDINSLTTGDMKDILNSTFPSLETLADCMLNIYQLVTNSRKSSNVRQISFRDLIKLFRRIEAWGSPNDHVLIFQELVDCFAAYVRDGRSEVMEILGVNVNLNKDKVDYFDSMYKPSLEVRSNQLIIGRSTLNIAKRSRPQKNCDFAQTRLSLLLLEKLSVCVNMGEPVLLVGETGCGKTMTVQVLASHLGKTLHVVNLSQQSESSDLFGGYKPLDLAHNMKRFKEQYVDLFCRSFSSKKNEKFLNHIKTCYETNNWKILVQLMLTTIKKLLSKQETVNSCILLEWLQLYEDLRKISQTLNVAKEGLLFSFVQGILTRAIKNGEWILLDEINLASAETLDCLNTILDTQSTLGLESDMESCSAHKDFRLFACMNPSTDVGKRELIPALRNRFTEIYVEELNSVEDLCIVVDEYLRGIPLSNDPSKRSDKILEIVKFYLTAKSIAKTRLKSDSWGHFPSYSLRTLCRALQFVRMKFKSGNILRILYEGFCMSFLTELDCESYQLMRQMIADHILGKNMTIIKAILNQPLEAPENGKFVPVFGFWLQTGSLTPAKDEKYILSATVKRNLTDVSRIVSAQSYPVLLQGETSVGKTSLIKFLAQLTGNKCVRINNHEHTDIQEYVGSYVTQNDGKLVFVEGPLVQAMREGFWIILDELNLAPPDVLEALNRVLDDNRELFIAETQEVVRAHPNFMLFATQNPYGLYGGRKQLSRAFRNRFIELHFSELPCSELEYILHMRCSLPPSYAKKMVKTMQDLQIHRNTTGVFAGRESYMTLRDLFRWGERYRLANLSNSEKSTFHDWDQYLVDQGYFLLGGRCRRADDHDTVCNVLKKCFARKIDGKSLFSLKSPYLRLSDDFLRDEFSHVVWTHNFRRMAVLTSQSLLYGEPVLLIGDTGCGKTTLCQILAKSIVKKLHMINCHMMTEAADFVGRICSANLEKLQNGILFEWKDGPLVISMKNGEPLLIDEISLADDSVLERINSVLEPEKTLLVSEMGDSTNQAIVAAHGFNVFATMNPGGDYGKKELSRALRNRFTEIWCESEYEKEDIVAIVGRSFSIRKDSSEFNSGFSLGALIFEFIAWIKMYSSDSSKVVVTIRDVISWVNFVNRCTSITGLKVAIVHGAFVTFLDGFGCSRNSFITKESRDKFCQSALRILIQLVNDNLAGKIVNVAQFSLENLQLDRSKSGFLGIKPFYIAANSSCISEVKYCFNSQVCLSNIFKMLRAFEAGKPILLEGSPGVGKSSVVVALAKATGRNITRINLSEQTDLNDLFGSDVPVTLENKQQGFAWVDGPLLTAVKNGDWVLIDEMNLASQTVLEGLNACFDHRREIFIPQLNRSFSINSAQTQFFACQNPYSEGASRKGLPKSFLNRFTTVFVDKLDASDLELILKSSFPTLDDTVIRKMVFFNEKINEEVTERHLWGHSGGPWEFNLRDLLRWATVMVNTNSTPEDSVNVFFVDRLRTLGDREQMIRCFEECFEHKYRIPYLDYTIGRNYFSIGNIFLKRNPSTNRPNDTSQESESVLLRSTLNPMRSLMHCIESKNLAILVGEPGSGKSILVENLAKICNTRLRTFYLTSDTDSSDLLGCFEQVLDGGCEKSLGKLMQSVSSLRLEFLRICFVNQKMNIVKMLLEDICDDESRNVDKTIGTLKSVAKELGDSRMNAKLDILLHDRSSMNVSNFCEDGSDRTVKFSWVDSPLVKAMQNGDWLLVKNVHYCNPAVLDRLNALLETGGELLITEKGSIDGKSASYKPHKDFRIIFTMHPGKMNTISRAMRNRGVEIYFPSESTWLNDRQDCFNILKTKFRIEVHLFEKIWSGLKVLRQTNHTVGASDLLKVAFVAREVLAKYGNLADAVKTAFQIVFSHELDFKQLEEEKCYRQYSSISRLTSQVNLFHMFKETSYLQWAMKNFKQPSEFKRIIKFYLLSASKSDYDRRSHVCQRLLAEFMIGDGSILENIRYCFKQIEAACVYFESDEPLDMRWSPSSISIRSFIPSTVPNNSATFQRIALYQLLSFTKTLECSTNLENESLLNLAAQALNGNIPKDQLPSKALLFLPSFFENLFFLIKDFINMDVKSLSYVIRDVWLGLLAIKNLYNMCVDRINVPVVEFWHQFKVEIKLLWKFIVKHFRQVLAVSDIGIQIADEISTRWIADSEHSRRYKYDLKVFDVCRAFANADEFAAAKNRQSWLCFFNKNLNSMFDDLDASIRNQLMKKRRQLCLEGFTDEDPSMWFSSIFNKQDENLELMDDDGQDRKTKTDHIFGLKRNLFADYVSFLCSLSKIDARTQNCNQSLFDDHLQLSLRHCGQISDNILSPDDNTLNGPAKDFFKYLNLESPLKRFMGDELFSLKIANLIKFPAMGAAFMQFFDRNFSSAGQWNVPLSMIDAFDDDLRYFCEFLWTVGPLLPTAKRNFMNFVESTVDRLNALLKESELLGSNVSCSSESLSALVDFGRKIAQRFTPPKNFLDPVEKALVKHKLRNLQLNDAESELHLANERYRSFTNQNMVNDDQFCVPDYCIHPYLHALLDIKNTLSQKLAEKSMCYCYRPFPNKFDAAIIELENFYGAIESFIDAIQKSLPQNWTIDELKMIVRKIQNFLCSADNFVDNVAREKYLAYRDIMDSFLLGVDLLRLAFSEQLLYYLRKIKCLEIEENYSIKAEEFSTFSTSLMKCSNDVTNQDAAKFFPDTSDAMKIILLNRYTNPGKSTDCLKKLLNLYQNWTIENERDDRYYEYKSKEPTKAEEQEEYHIAALFPNFMTEGVFQVEHDVSGPVDESSFAHLFRDLSQNPAELSKEAYYLQNYRLATNLVLPNIVYFDIEFDFQNYDSHILAAKHALACFGEVNLDQKNENRRPLNVYRHGRLSESKKLKLLLDDLKSAVQKLLIEWYDNAILLQLLETCDKILQMPAQAPIIKLMTALESLLDDAAEWENIASRVVKLESNLQPLRSLYVEWRKMEIKGWEFLLDDAEGEHENSALISVLKFHLVVKSFIDGGIDRNTLLTAYSNLLSFCPLGEFHTRLRASKTIAKVLLSENPSILSYLINLNAYFECFAAKINGQITNLRSPIEKELKDFIKIVKFQDLNVYRAKETGRHAHRQLFKMVRSYKEALQDPVAKQLNIALTVPQEVIDDCKSSVCPKIPDHDTNFSANNQRLEALISYFSKFNQFSSNLTAQLTDDRPFREINDDLCQTASDFGSEIIKNVNYGDVREENLKLYKRNKQKRTNLLIDLFENLRLNGFRYREGVSIANEKLDALIFEFDGSKSICGRTIQRFDRLFWYCIQRKNILDQISGQKPHDQIDGNISQRCVGYVKLFVKMLTNLRQNLLNWDTMTESLSKFEKLFQISSSKNCPIDFFELQNRGREMLTSLSDLGRNLSQKLERTVDIWYCNLGLNKENFNLNPISDKSPILTFLDHKDERFSNYLATLKQISSDVKDLRGNIAEIEDSSKRVDGYLSLENFKQMSGICSKLKSVEPALKDLLDISSNPHSADANFYNTYLMECRDLIENFNCANSPLLIDSKSMLRNNDDLAENLANKLYFTVQELWRVLDTQSGSKDSDDTIVGKLNECKMFSSVLNFEKILQLSNKLMEECRSNSSSVNPFICSIFSNYSTVCKTFSTYCFSMYVKFSIFFLGIVESWIHLLKEGFVKEVPDLEADDQNKLKNGGEKFEDLENAGMGEGRGAKDVSDDIEDLGQVEGLKKNENNENLDPEEDEKIEHIDKPLEIEDDFEASLEDLDLNDEEEKSDDGNDEKDEQADEPDWQKGEAENPENDQLDPKMWNDREEEQNPTLDDKTEGAEDAQEDMVAKDQNKIPEEENEEKAESNELEMDDREEQPQPGNQDDVENIDLSEMIDRDGSDEDEESSSVKNSEKDEEIEAEREGEIDDDLIHLEDQEAAIEEEAQPTKDQNPSNDAQTMKQSGESDRNDDPNLNEKNRQEIENQLDDDLTKEGLKSEKDDTVSNEKEDDGGKSGRSFAKKRSSREDEADERSSENPKKQKVDESKKTLAVKNQQREMIEKSREVCEIDDLDDVIEIDDDTTYAHQPNLNSTEKVKQVLDSASLDIAKEQVAQKEKDSQMDVDIVEENEEDSTKKDRKEKEAPRYSGTTIDHESTTTLDEDSTDDVMILGEYKPSTIHTCLDFYNQASTSKIFENETLQPSDYKNNTNADESNQQNKVLWAKYALWTQALASELSENLRLTLEPTLATKYQGDYRTGKRLNIRKLIPYIASFYRKNKIWLRRTKKAKRDYQIMLAIDDSSSMNDNKTKQLAFESLALMSNALRYLESGQLAVCKFGEQTHLLHPFDREFDDDEGARTISNLTFEQKGTNIIPLMDFCASYFNENLTSSISSRNSDLPAQLLLIVSDGRGIFGSGMEKVKSAVQKAISRQLFVVFVILDNPNNKDSIMDIKVPLFGKTGPPEIKSYLEFFPFAFYVILRRINELPAVLGDALRQWFEILSTR